MNINELREFIASKHRPDLAQRPGMVWQVWEDGELTLQKSGELLWQRNLHCIMPGIVRPLREAMPVQSGQHAYAFIESEGVGKEIREKMVEFVKQLV